VREVRLHGPAVRLDVGGQRRVDQDGRGLGAQPVVLAPCLRLPHLRQRLDARGQVQDRVHAAQVPGYGRRIEQVEFGPARGARLVAFGLRPGQERSSEYTGSPGYEQTHRTHSLSLSRADVASLRRRAPDGHRPVSRCAGWPPGHDERVEVRIALDALDPPAGTIRVSGDDIALRFTGWLGLLRVLYQVMGSPAGLQAAAPDTQES
jgi:hypothetical protein